jgi:predicted DsbA family dithiol-disulfide isomerase
MSDAAVLKIDFIADVVCPWCYLGWRRLQTALSQRPDVAVEIIWRPYQLAPDLPEEGIDRAEYYRMRFRDPKQLEQSRQMLEGLARDEGFEMNLSRGERMPNTLAAQRLIRWAQGQGKQDVLLEPLMSAYFRDGRDVGDPQVLADIAAEAGLDPVLTLELLAGESDKDTVRREHQIAVEAGVSGVPCMIFDGKFAVMGAESVERLGRAIDHALQQRAQAGPI